jgi:hypothetical protein
VLGAGWEGEWELRNERRHGEIDVMNITYIHLMVSDSYIYMYRRRRIYKKTPWRNTIIERIIHI